MHVFEKRQLVVNEHNNLIVVVISGLDIPKHNEPAYPVEAYGHGHVEKILQMLDQAGPCKVVQSKYKLNCVRWVYRAQWCVQYRHYCNTQVYIHMICHNIVFKRAMQRSCSTSPLVTICIIGYVLV